MGRMMGHDNVSPDVTSGQWTLVDKALLVTVLG